MKTTAILLFALLLMNQQEQAALAEFQLQRSERLERQKDVHSEGLVREATVVFFPGAVKTDVKLQSTDRLPDAKGLVNVERRSNLTSIEVRLQGLTPATLFGGDYNTYVLWIISPEGQAANAGEFKLNDSAAELTYATTLSAFGMIVTAEPHYLVSAPSRFVVLEYRQSGGSLEAPVVEYRGIGGGYNFERATLAGAPKAKGEVLTGLRQAWTAVRLARSGGLQWAAAEFAYVQQVLAEILEVSKNSGNERILEPRARELVRLASGVQRLAHDRALYAELQDRRNDSSRALELEQTAGIDERQVRPSGLTEPPAGMKDFEKRPTGVVFAVPESFFHYRRTDLRPEGEERLIDIAEILRTHAGIGGMYIRVLLGDAPTASPAQQLLSGRADAVRRCLVSAGITGVSVKRSMNQSESEASHLTDGQRGAQPPKIEIVIEDRLIPMSERIVQ